MSNTTDVLIIGAGHNGLVCAYYLAAAGLSVKMLERRGVVGGAAVTEEFHPGFKNSVASYTVSLLNPKVIADLELARHGLRVVDRKVQNFLPLDDRRYLATGAGRTKQEVAKFSNRDAEQLDAYNDRLAVLADLVRDVLLKTPPNARANGWVAGLAELLGSAGLGKRLAGLDTTARRDLLALFGQSCGDMLDTWFESEPIKAVLGFDGIVGNYASPYTPGSAYVLLHHVFGEVNGVKGAWGHAIGGMGAITQAMAKACEAVGVDIRTNAPVARVLVKKGRAAGVILESGETITADRVVGNLHPQLLFTKLLSPEELDPDFVHRMDNYVSGSGTFRMNVALSELPKFRGMPDTGDHLGSGIICAPSLDYMERAY